MTKTLEEIGKAGVTPCCKKSLKTVKELKLLKQTTWDRGICQCECGQIVALDMNAGSITFLDGEAKDFE